MSIHELEQIQSAARWVKLQESETRCARAEARIVELEGTIAGLRAKMEILVYPENAYKEYKAK